MAMVRAAKGSAWGWLREQRRLGTTLRTRESRLLMAAAFALDAIAGMVVLGFGNAYLIETVKAPDAYPAYAIAIYGVVKLMTAPPGGWLLERVNGGTVAVAGGVAAVTGLMVVVATGTAGAYLAAIALVSAGQSLAWLALYHAFSEHHDGETRAAATALMGIVSAGATGLGLGAAAAFDTWAPWRAAFIAGAALTAVATLSLVRIPAVSGGMPTNPTSGRQAVPVSEGRLASGAVVFIHFAIVSALVAGLAPLALRTLDLSLVQAGMALAPAVPGAAIGLLVIAPRSRQGTRARLAARLYLGAAVCIVLAAIAPNAGVLAIAALPLGLAIGAGQPVVNAALIDAAQAEARSGVALGYLFFVQGAGNIAGPGLTGLVIETSSVRAGVFAIAVLGATVSGIALALARRT
jgi:MFS family permease